MLDERLLNEERELREKGYEFKSDYVRSTVTVHTTHGDEKFYTFKKYLIQLHANGYYRDPSRRIYGRSHHLVEIYLSDQYPFGMVNGAPFRGHWRSPIFHPNLQDSRTASDGMGAICWQFFEERATGLTSLVSIVKALEHLVENPNPNSPLRGSENLDAAKWFIDNRRHGTIVPPRAVVLQRPTVRGVRTR